MSGPAPRRLRRLSDEELVGRINSGEAAALETLYERHCGAAFAYARRLLEDDVLAEESVRSVFLSVWRLPTPFPPGRGTVRAWILAKIGGEALARRPLAGGASTG
jgi:DNA-directed RNA polymerase specialized sigma24 family protein